MLQKSKSTTISKFKYLILVPLMFTMLTYVACSEQIENTTATAEGATLEKDQILTVPVKDFKNITPEEKVRIDETISGFSFSESDFKMIRITDGTSGMEITETEEGSIDISMIGEPTKKREQQPISQDYADGDIPFAIIEEVPVFPGCEGLASNEERKACMSQKVTDFVSQNFNTRLGKGLGLTGINRIYVQFRINKTGGVDVLGARAPHPALQEEAERVVNLLPQMNPGKQQGKEVGVLYSLPISFNAGE